MANEVDLVVQSLGSNPFRPLGSPVIDPGPYETAIKLRKLSRTLKQIGCGADPDLAPNLQALLDEIGRATGGDPRRLGVVCLFGTSNGSGLILALARALNRLAGAPRLTYVAVGDLTMMPFGRSPDVPGIGTLQPVNAPDLGLLVTANPFAGLFGRGLPVSASDIPPPRIADPGIVADRRDNHFTAQGNRVRLFSLSPAGADSWWWTSTQNFGEVHGRIDGWTNLERVTTSSGSVIVRGPGSIDEGHHDDLCGKALLDMKADAATELLKAIQKFPIVPP